MQTTESVDYIIVGQGLAGTFLAHFLEKANQKVQLFDQTMPCAASRVAAGLINPITGRRYVKSWKIDELLPFAKKVYQELEALLGISIYAEKNLIRSLFNSREENDWFSRSGDPGYASYMADKAEIGKYATTTVPVFSYGEVEQSGRADLLSLVEAYRKLWLEKGNLIADSFDYTAIEFLEEGVRYQNFTAQKIIFCEGAKGVDNPFFGYLPFTNAKGEVLQVRIPDADFKKILKHRIFLIPLQDDLYWVGSTYDWDFKDAEPTPEGRNFLEERLKDVLKVPFEIVQHQAAIRPTVKDRRPFLGIHREFPSLAIFNGMGTKGASLGPFWAHHMADFLVNNGILDQAVDISRFT